MALRIAYAEADLRERVKRAGGSWNIVIEYRWAEGKSERSSTLVADLLAQKVEVAGECADAIPPRELGDHSYFAHLVVEDVDEYHQRAVERGAEIVKPLRDEPWGMRGFGLRTVDGHRVMIGSRLVQESGRGSR